MGVFAESQPRYAEHGIATFPVNDEKKPLVARYADIGIKASGQLALDPRFADCENLAFMAGKHSRVTVVDVDTEDENVWREAERVFGPTPLWVRTGRGHLQMLYRHNGEKRDTNSKFLGCIDLLGDGQVLGFPSQRGQGYINIRGNLDDLNRLPVLRGLDRLTPANDRRITTGTRHNRMLAYLRTQAQYCDDLSQLIDVGITFADDVFDRTGGHDFTNDEIKRLARNVWDWTQERIGARQYYVGKGRYLQLSHDAIDKVLPLGADATMLFMYLKRRSDHRSKLVVANDMRLTMPDGEWTLARFRKARQKLIDAAILTETRKASTWHGPATYAWQG